jgi:hypothetical protein
VIVLLLPGLLLLRAAAAVAPLRAASLRAAAATSLLRVMTSGAPAAPLLLAVAAVSLATVLALLCVLFRYKVVQREVQAERFSHPDACQPRAALSRDG